MITHVVSLIEKQDFVLTFILLACQQQMKTQLVVSSTDHLSLHLYFRHLIHATLYYFIWLKSCLMCSKFLALTSGAKRAKDNTSYHQSSAKQLTNKTLFLLRRIRPGGKF